MASLGQRNNKSILEQCTELSNGIRDVENKLEMLDTLQKRILADTSGDSVAKQKLDSLEDEIMAQYRALTDQFRAIKSHPQSGQARYAAQVGLVDRRLREANHKFQVLKSAFSKEMKGQMERQLRIIRPDASDVEIQKMVESGNSAVFQQALMQGNARLGMADDVLNNVNQRHRDLLRIEEQLVELLKLMELMEVELEKQDAMVAEIDAQAEAAAEEMVKANEELQTAVVTARKTRKKKWICLGICGTWRREESSLCSASGLTCGLSYYSPHYCYCRGRIHPDQPRRKRRRRPSKAQPLPPRRLGWLADEHCARSRVCR